MFDRIVTSVELGSLTPKLRSGTLSHSDGLMRFNVGHLNRVGKSCDVV